MCSVHVSTHPLVQHKLAILRDERTDVEAFRRVIGELTAILGIEATANLATKQVEVKTPIATGEFPMLENDLFTIVPILRAGVGMQDGLLKLIPSARIGMIGLKREEVPVGVHIVEYYKNLPLDIADSHVLLVDPMLATGSSAVVAAQHLKEHGCRDIKFLCTVASPEGIAAFEKAQPDVDIYVAAIDDCLDENFYIVPGLGDAGDRIFGTPQE